MQAVTGVKIEKIDEVAQRLRKSRSGVYRLIAAGLFPKPIKIGRNSGWPEHDTDAFLAARVAERERSA